MVQLYFVFVILEIKERKTLKRTTNCFIVKGASGSLRLYSKQLDSAAIRVVFLESVWIFI